MVHHIKEGQDQYGVSRSQQIVGAILRHSSNPCDVDAWHLCHDLDEMFRRDAREVIYGRNEAEIESEIWKRHPVDGSGVSLVTKAFGRWEIERAPRLTHADLDMLHGACALHKRILVGNDLVSLLGGPEKLLRLGFLLADRNSRSAQLVRYNPRQVTINRWKKEVKTLGQYLQPQFPPQLVENLFDVVKPENWPDDHPYQGFLEAPETVAVVEDPRDSGSCQRRSQPANLTGAPETILTFVEIAGRLGKGEHRRPWRQSWQWKELLEKLVEYVHGVQASGNDDWRQLARWVRREARVAKVKIPRKRKLPPRPTFGRKAGRRSRVGTKEKVHD